MEQYRKALIEFEEKLKAKGYNGDFIINNRYRGCLGDGIGNIVGLLPESQDGGFGSQFSVALLLERNEDGRLTSVLGLFPKWRNGVLDIDGYHIGSNNGGMNAGNIVCFPGYPVESLIRMEDAVSIIGLANAEVVKGISGPVFSGLESNITAAENELAFCLGAARDFEKALGDKGFEGRFSVEGNRKGEFWDSISGYLALSEEGPLDTLTRGFSFSKEFQPEGTYPGIVLLGTASLEGEKIEVDDICLAYFNRQEELTKCIQIINLETAKVPTLENCRDIVRLAPELPPGKRLKVNQGNKPDRKNRFGRSGGRGKGQGL